MKDQTTVEPEYDPCLALQKKRGFARFGLMSNYVWHDDPRRVAFILARYKFVSKMFSGRQHVFEVGCADAFGTRIVKQEVARVTALDIDPVFVKDAQANVDEAWPIECRIHDMLSDPAPGGPYDGAYSLDVLEHIPPAEEDRFIGNIAASLTPHGAVIVGSPSLQSQAYASSISKGAHVNCKDGAGLRQLMQRFFENVFIFSMNDEVVHTGFYPMAHYLLALGCTRTQGGVIT